MRNCLGVTLVAVAVIALLAMPVTGQMENPGDAVFMLAVLRQDREAYTLAEYGTAFFISADGIALTNSHLVYAAQHDPEHVRLLAIVGQEFYSVEIICASKLLSDPAKTTFEGVSPRRDVAEIKVVPATFPLDSLSYHFETGEELTIATAHRGDLPHFPSLTITGYPQLGSHIRVIGFGQISALPRKWTANGLISGFDHAVDGTETFDIEFSNPAQPGNSGSPALDDHQQVIGMFTWFSMDRPNLGTAQSNSALQRPCR